MKKYIIIKEYTTEELTKQVNKYLKANYELAGNLLVLDDGTNMNTAITYIQSMISLDADLA